MWRGLVLLFVGLVALTAPALAGGIETRTINVNGMLRTYYFMHPASVKGPGPLIVGFHGGGQDAMKFGRSTGLIDYAKANGYVLALPQGVENSWNPDMPTPQGFSALNDIDDVGFIDAMLNALVTSGEIDSSRIYGTGVSEGGMMAYDSACSLPGYFNALGVVAGTIASGNCRGVHNLSLLHIHGTNDQHVPFLGGRGTYTGAGVYWASALDGINTVAQGDTCSPTYVPKPLTSDTTCFVSQCSGTNQVQYCLVQNGGHTWPGLAPTNKQKQQSDGFSTMTFSATEMIGSFFAQH